MREVAHTIRLRTSAVGQAQIAVHHVRFGRIVELVVLRQIWLHYAQPYIIHELGRVRPESYRAITDKREQDHNAYKERTARVWRINLVVVKHCRRRADGEAEKCQRPDANQWNALRKHKRLCERVAERIPGKSAEQVTTQPLGRGHCCGEGQQTFRSAQPDQASNAKTECGVEREVGWKSRDRDRQEPSECLHVDQEGVADPVEPGEEVSEAETPTCERSIQWSAQPSR